MKLDTMPLIAVLRVAMGQPKFPKRRRGPLPGTRYGRWLDPARVARRCAELLERGPGRRGPYRTRRQL